MRRIILHYGLENCVLHNKNKTWQTKENTISTMILLDFYYEYIFWAIISKDLYKTANLKAVNFKGVNSSFIINTNVFFL